MMEVSSPPEYASTMVCMSCSNISKGLRECLCKYNAYLVCPEGAVKLWGQVAPVEARAEPAFGLTLPPQRSAVHRLPIAKRQTNRGHDQQTRQAGRHPGTD